jgi:hypothetical protein
MPRFSDFVYRHYLEGSNGSEASGDVDVINQDLALVHDDAPGLLLPPGWRIVMSPEAAAAVSERRAQWERDHPAVPTGPPVQRDFGF